MLKILLVLLLSLSHSVFADEAINTITKPSHYGIFDFMQAEVAKSKAEEMAREDYKQGNYRYLVYGLRMDEKSFGGYPEQRYAIKDTPVAGCIVTGSVEEATDSYNSTMRQLLDSKVWAGCFQRSGRDGYAFKTR